MTLLDKLVELTNKSESELLESLNLTNEFSSKDLAKALGVYGLFLDKSELENYIKIKVQNKIKENEELQNKLNDSTLALEKITNEKLALSEDLNNISTNIKNLFINEWNKNKLPEIDFNSLNIKDIDLSNISNSINKVVKEKNIEVPKIEPARIENEESFGFPTGAQVLSFGAKRIK